MRCSRTIVWFAASLLYGAAQAQLTLDRPLAEPAPYHVDSGELANPGGVPRALHEEVVRIDGAAWLRLYFGDVVLEPGSYVRMQSDLDGEVQELDADGLEAWGGTSAYFNGDTVRVTVIAGPGTQHNRLVIDRVGWEAGADSPLGGCGICGTDDRIPSSETFAARLLPAGCSATVYSAQSCIVSAGHCMGGGMVLQFNVPPSSPSCGLNHPPIEEQFPITQFSSSNGGVGNDWAVMLAGTNNLGQKPFDRYGVFKPIAQTPPAIGQSLTIWGYGVDSQCTQTQVQQTSGGTVSAVSGTFFNHNVDATFGNSGSSLMRNGAEILGIATHCPCPNFATRIDHPSFAAARASLCPFSAAQAASLLSATVVVGTPMAVGVEALEDSDDKHFEVDAVLVGVRNNALTEVVAQAAVGLNELSIRVEFGPANAQPVFYTLQLFNQQSGMWENLEFGMVSTTAATIVDTGELPGPNAYVNASGQVRLRVAQTARAPQTPLGYTQLIDQVEVLYVN
jgi:hypothetical protein